MELAGANVLILFVAFFFAIVAGYYAIIGGNPQQSSSSDLKENKKNANKKQKESKSTKDEPVKPSKKETPKAKTPKAEAPSKSKAELASSKKSAPEKKTESSKNAKPATKSPAPEPTKPAQTKKQANVTETKVAPTKKSSNEKPAVKPSAPAPEPPKPKETKNSKKKKDNKNPPVVEEKIVETEDDSSLIRLAAIQAEEPFTEQATSKRGLKKVAKRKAAAEEKVQSELETKQEAAVEKASSNEVADESEAPKHDEDDDGFTVVSHKREKKPKPQIKIVSAPVGDSWSPSAQRSSASNSPASRKKNQAPAKGANLRGNVRQGSSPSQASPGSRSKRFHKGDAKVATSYTPPPALPQKKKVRTSIRTFPGIPRQTRGKIPVNATPIMIKRLRLAKTARRAQLAGRTELGAASHDSTRDGRLDLFFKTVRDITLASLESLLNKSWAKNPLDTLKIIFQARDCRGGKGEKALFYASMRWLGKYHPEQLKKNLKLIPTYGTWKDLLLFLNSPFEQTALEIFVNQLKADLASLHQIELMQKDTKKSKDDKKLKPTVSLAAKWAPTERQGKDVDHAVKKIAKMIFPQSKKPFEDYRKKCIKPLRTYIMVTEQKMCSNQWSKIPYTGVASRCMNRTRNAFRKHDSERFNKFIEDVKSGKKTIKGTQMFPHELVAKYFNHTQEVDDVLELQWKAIVDEVRKDGALSNCMVLSDVSGSMSGTPMQVSIALGLLVSEIIDDPFKNLVITFSEIPTFHVVKGTTLKERVRDLQSAAWGNGTNFQAALEMILQKATENKIPVDQMPTKLFVISDMQFDVADRSYNQDTNHTVLINKYKQAGYPVPQIIYWNVRSNTIDFPVAKDQKGAALISGFSPSILKTLMKEGEVDPISIMKLTIDAQRYSEVSM